MPQLKVALYQLDKLIEEHVPDIGRILSISGVSSEVFAIQWFVTLFSYDISWPKLSLVWDFFLFKGWKFLFQFAISILLTLPKNEHKLDAETLIIHIKRVVKTRSIPELVKKALGQKITNKQLKALEMQYNQVTPHNSIRKKLNQQYANKDESLELSQGFDSIGIKQVYSFPARTEYIDRVCKTSRVSYNRAILKDKHYLFDNLKPFHKQQYGEEKKVNERISKVVAYKLPVKVFDPELLDLKVLDDSYSRNNYRRPQI